MSEPNGPVNRRRIAGESTPAVKKATAKKAPAKKTTVKKAAAKKAPAKTSAAKAAPVAKAVPPRKVATPVKKAAPPTPSVASGASVIAKSRQPEASGSASTRGDGPSRRDLGWLIPASLLAMASLVIGAFLAFQGLKDITQDDGERASNEKAASAAASAAAETIFSYQFNKLDEHLTASKKLMTTSFAKDFEKIAPALDEVAPQRQVQVQAVGRNAAALSCGDECSPGTVNVLVFLDQARLVDGSKQPDVIGNRITMKMVHRDGQWLVDDIRAV
ncbi:hypothetical protein GCM10022234_23720 [Aeromicrobium panaciterrae]|uniref:hypothetical protein n=1 Tax=Aeromicrobium panaciterrae TaxID=363861 RepID=UPI0031D6DB21